MLSNTVEYALRAIAFLAFEAPQARTTEEIATATKVPSAYLSKVLQSLAKAGLVKSQRGVGGGMSLAKSAEVISILEVVTAVEPIKRIKSCPLELKTHGVRLCPLHKRLDDAIAMVEKAFRETSLAEVLSQPTGSPPLCEVGTEKARK